MRIYTVGHSTHPFDAFVALLAHLGIGLLADVRTAPRSRRHPQFNTETLAAAMPSHGIAYRHFKALGGWRRPRTDSPNGGWDSSAFQGYADHMLTPEFAAAFVDLTEPARETPTAIMCAEGLWWRCHRRLLADRLLTGGWTVCHIGPDGALAHHALPPFAAPQPDGSVLYPPPTTLLSGA